MKVELAVLGSLSLIISLMVSVDVKGGGDSSVVRAPDS